MAKYLSFDVGSKTIGIAKSDGILASSLTTIRFPSDDFLQAMVQLSPIIASESPKEIAVGWPKNMDGSEGHRIEMVKRFLEHFKKAFPDIKIIPIDERLTTKMAKSIMIEADLSRKKQKQNKDALAAILILESFLMRKNHI